MAFPTKPAFAAFKDFVPAVLGRIGVTQQNFAVISLVERELAGYAPHAQIVGFRNNKVYVEVDSSVVLNECYFQKREIYRRLEGSFPAESKANLPEIKFYLKGLARLGAKEKADNRRENSPLFNELKKKGLKKKERNICQN